MATDFNPRKGVPARVTLSADGRPRCRMSPHCEAEADACTCSGLGVTSANMLDRANLRQVRAKSCVED